jgi:hypothetical protein
VRRPTTLLRRVAAPTVTVLSLLGLAGCALPGLAIGGDDSVDLPAGTRLFASRPETADCSRVDIVALRQISGEDLPAPEPVLAPDDASRPNLTWAGCIGRQTTSASQSSSASSTDDPSASPRDQTPAAERSSAGTGSQDSSGTVVWMVWFATSAAATSDKPRDNPLAGQADVRLIDRRTTLADSPADIQLGVHADDHQTLVLVTVEDPGTHRAAAECGVAGVPGDAADDAVQWCLKSISGQLLRRSGGVSPTTG